MSKELRTGTVDWVSGQQAPVHTMEIADALGEIIVRVTGVLNVTVAATLHEDGVLNSIRQWEFGVGSVPVKICGDNSMLGAAGRIRYYMNQLEYGNLPVLNQPAVGVAANAFDFTFTVPVQYPKLFGKEWPEGSRVSTMLSPTAKRKEVTFHWGTVNDVISAGTATLVTTVAEIIARVYPKYNAGIKLEDGTYVPFPYLLYENTQQIIPDLGATTEDVNRLNRKGMVPCIGLMGISTSLRNDALWNNLEFRKNVDDRKIRASWGALKALAQERAGLQAATFLPTGINMAFFDGEQDGDGMVDLTNALAIQGWDLAIDHAALGATQRMYAHHYYLGAQG